MAFNQYNYQNQYNKEHYTRLTINIDKSDKEPIERHWKKLGYKSFTAYVLELIRKDMNENRSDISIGTINQSGSGNSININNKGE